MTVAVAAPASAAGLPAVAAGGTHRPRAVAPVGLDIVWASLKRRAQGRGGRGEACSSEERLIKREPQTYLLPLCASVLVQGRVTPACPPRYSVGIWLKTHAGPRERGRPRWPRNHTVTTGLRRRSSLTIVAPVRFTGRRRGQRRRRATFAEQASQGGHVSCAAVAASWTGTDRCGSSTSARRILALPLAIRRASTASRRHPNTCSRRTGGRPHRSRRRPPRMSARPARQRRHRRCPPRRAPRRKPMRPKTRGPQVPRAPRRREGRGPRGEQPRGRRRTRRAP